MDGRGESKTKRWHEVKISLLKPTELVRLMGVESYDFNFYSNSEDIEGYYRGNTIVRPFQKSGTIYVPNENKTWREATISLSKNPQGRAKRIPLRRIVRIEIVGK